MNRIVSACPVCGDEMRVVRLRCCHLGSMALHDLQRAARAGVPGHLIDVTNDERGERVEIFFD